MTPDSAAEPAGVWDVIRATTPPPDGRVFQRKWNWSAVPPMPAPPPWIVQLPLLGLRFWPPAGVAFPMSPELQPEAESSVHITRAVLDVKLPTVVTLAATMSSPSAAPGEVKAAWPLASVTTVPDSPASGPLVTEKLTVALGSPAPLPSRSVAVSVTGCPVNCVAVAGPRLSVACPVPVAPMACHWIDSLCFGGQ